MCDNATSKHPRPLFITYDVFEEAGVVRAQLNYTQDDADNAIQNLCDNAGGRTITAYPRHSNTEMRWTYQGKIRVQEGDKFDVEVGKDKAKKRALERYHKAFNKRILEALLDARVLVATFEHYCMKKDIDMSKVDTIEEIKQKRFLGSQK